MAAWYSPPYSSNTDPDTWYLYHMALVILTLTLALTLTLTRTLTLALTLSLTIALIRTYLYSL